MNTNVTSLLKKLLVLSLVVATAAPLCAMEGDDAGAAAGGGGGVSTLARLAAGCIDRHLLRVSVRTTNLELLQAAAYGNLEVVRMLLDAGADVTFQDNDGRTALHMAALNGCVKVAEVLIENGAKTTVLDIDGRTPADIAHELGNLPLEITIRGFALYKRCCAICTTVASVAVPLVATTVWYYVCSFIGTGYEYPG